jgi:hypothetical protein
MVTRKELYEAIRQYCLDCKTNQALGVKHCENKECNFWLYRFGTASEDLVPELKARLDKEGATEQ